MINAVHFDFYQRYTIGLGTGPFATMDTIEEAADYLEAMDPLDRHFCSIYDREKNRLTHGSLFRWEIILKKRKDAPDTADIWHRWA